MKSVLSILFVYLTVTNLVLASAYAGKLTPEQKAVRAAERKAKQERIIAAQKRMKEKALEVEQLIKEQDPNYMSKVEREKEYYQRPEVKERLKEHRQRPDVKEREKQRKKEYRQRPDVKERRNKYARLRYHKRKLLLMNKDPGTVQDLLSRIQEIQDNSEPTQDESRDITNEFIADFEHQLNKEQEVQPATPRAEFACNVLMSFLEKRNNEDPKRLEKTLVKIYDSTSQEEEEEEEEEEALPEDSDDPSMNLSHGEDFLGAE